MDPMTAMAIANLASSGIQMGVGAVQDKRADDILDNLVRPEQKTPESATKAVKLYESMTGKNAPGYSNAIENIDAGTARTARAIRGSAGSSQEALQALLSLDAQNKDSFRGLDANNDAFRTQMMQLYGQGLSMLGEYEQANFDWNQKQKFLEEAAAASALKNAGIQNQVFAADKALSTAAIPFGTKSDADLSSDNVVAAAKTANTTTAGATPNAEKTQAVLDLEEMLYGGTGTAYSNEDMGSNKSTSTQFDPTPILQFFSPNSKKSFYEFE
jgi:hypothetical protein